MTRPTLAALRAHLERCDAIWNRRCRVRDMLAGRADPATGGNALYVHNWGNAAAKAVTARVEERYERRVRPILDARSDALMYLDHMANVGTTPAWARPETVAYAEAAVARRAKWLAAR